MPSTDPEILSRIGRLVERERELRAEHARGGLHAEDGALLADIEVELDRCWDLLNQRRALRETGQDPAAAKVRDADTVEHYQQ